MKLSLYGLLVFYCLMISPFATTAEELSDVIDEVITAAKENPENPDAQKRAGWGYLYLAREMGDDAARMTFGILADHYLDIAAQLDPGDDETLKLLAETAVLNRAPYKAATVYEILVSRQTDPADGTYLIPLHSCYQWLHDPWRGLFFYRKQLAKKTDWPQVKFLMATLLLELDRKEALEILWEMAGSNSTPDGLKATVRAVLKEES